MARKESALQKACVGWFRLQYRSRARLLFAVPNGGGRTRIEASIMNGEGVLAGVADLIYLESRGGYGSLCIEMKTRTGRQSPEQKEWQKAAEAGGNRYVVCRSFDDFKAAIEEYMALEASHSFTIDIKGQTPPPVFAKMKPVKIYDL